MKLTLVFVFSMILETALGGYALGKLIPQQPLSEFVALAFGGGIGYNNLAVLARTLR